MQTIGRYEVVRPLGRGGMGQVFLGRDPKLERSVALKLLKHDIDSPDARVLFEREAKALAALSHPNIITIFEIAEHEGRQFIAMEYLAGKSLRELLMHDKPPRDTLLAICGQVASALAAAHAADILHRDIKPENVVVGDTGTAKVVDFGIARRLGRSSVQNIELTKKAIAARAAELVDAFSQTMKFEDSDTVATAGPAPVSQPTDITAAANTVFGTPAYMAPEVLMGDASSPASDVYSLGVMLYECLTGKRPYDAPDLHAVIARAIDGEEHPARLDDPHGELIERMLDRDPAKRPSLVEIAKTLRPRPTTVAAPRRTRWLLPLAAIAALGVALVAFLALRGGAPRGKIAITGFEVEMTSYGSRTPDSRAYTRLIALLTRAAKVEVIPPDVIDKAVPPSTPAAQRGELRERLARAQGAVRLARGSLIERDGVLRARVTVIDLEDTSRTYETELTGSPAKIAGLLDDVAEWIAGTVRDGARIDRTPDRTRATELVDIGKPLLIAGEFQEARPFLEQAVDADPTFAEGWEHLASCLSYLAAAQPLIDAAIDRAYAITPDGAPRKQILAGARLYYRTQYPAARAELAKIDLASLSGADKIDAMYYLGESHWHDGFFDRGYDYFRRLLAADRKYTLAAKHAGEWAIARRRGDLAREYSALQQLPNDAAELAAGNYDALAKDGAYPFNAWAQDILELPRTAKPPNPFTEIELSFERLAVAVRAGDRPALAAELETFFKLIGDRPGPIYLNLLDLVSELVVTLGSPDETRRVIERLKQHPERAMTTRLAILAGPLIGKQPIDRSKLTHRMTVLADAIDAELAGDREGAVAKLRVLVDEPSFSWDFPERVALVRNLRALGRDDDAEAVCTATVRPPVMNASFFAARRICRDAKSGIGGPARP